MAQPLWRRVWKWENYWHRIEIIQGLGLGGGAWGNFLGDITVLYLDCAIDEMTGWHHQLNGHEFEQAPGDGEGQGSLVCCSPRGQKESDTTERLHNNN